MRKNIILIIILILSLQIYAQKTARVSNKVFKSEWFYGGNAGINLFVGEQIRESLLSQPLKSVGLIGRFALGYNFSPTAGIRGTLGFSNHNWPNKDSIPSFTSENLTLDFIYNISNQLFDYNLYRKYDFSIFVGTGVSYRNEIKNSYNKNLISSGTIISNARVGLQGDYRLSQFLDFNIIGELNIVSDNFNTSTTGVPIDIYPALMIGATYHLRGKKF